MLMVDRREPAPRPTGTRHAPIPAPAVEKPDTEGTAIATGPFDLPPCGLFGVVTCRSDGTHLEGHDIARLTAEWLRAVLHESGVVLGEYDHDVVETIAEAGGWPAAQVVSGWLHRTRR